MRKITSLITITLVLMFVMSTLVSAETTADVMTHKGVLIDNTCAADKTEDKLADFVKNHSKDCVMKCKDSGFSLYSDGKLYKFDEESNAEIIEFLEMEDSTLDVVVEVTHGDNDMLSLVSIKNNTEMTTTAPTTDTDSSDEHNHHY